MADQRGGKISGARALKGLRHLSLTISILCKVRNFFYLKGFMKLDLHVIITNPDIRNIILWNLKNKEIYILGNPVLH